MILWRNGLLPFDPAVGKMYVSHKGLGKNKAARGSRYATPSQKSWHRYKCGHTPVNNVIKKVRVPFRICILSLKLGGDLGPHG